MGDKQIPFLQLPRGKVLESSSPARHWLVRQLNISPLCAAALFVEFNLGKQVAHDVPSGASRLCKRSHQRRFFFTLTQQEKVSRRNSTEMQIPVLWWGCLIITFCVSVDVSDLKLSKNGTRNTVIWSYIDQTHYKGANSLSVLHIWLKCLHLSVP